MRRQLLGKRYWFSWKELLMEWNVPGACTALLWKFQLLKISRNSSERAIQSFRYFISIILSFCPRKGAYESNCTGGALCKSDCTWKGICSSGNSNRSRWTWRIIFWKEEAEIVKDIFINCRKHFRIKLGTLNRFPNIYFIQGWKHSRKASTSLKHKYCYIICWACLKTQVRMTMVSDPSA